MKNNEKKIFSTDNFLDELFSNKLSDTKKFDPEIIDLIRSHLGQPSIQSKAGKNLAAEIVELADKRSQGKKNDEDNK